MYSEFTIMHSYHGFNLFLHSQDLQYAYLFYSWNILNIDNEVWSVHTNELFAVCSTEE